jgi:hypothetical protein
MRVLVACEFSGIVREAFRKRGHDAWSCDLLPTEIPGQHLQMSVHRAWANEDFELIICFPPCTHLASSGARWFKLKSAEQAEAIQFFKECMAAPAPHVAVENPIGIMSTHCRKPDQIIQPWQFGHGETKATCFWLRCLPKLVPTNIVDGRRGRVWLEPPSPNRWKNRSRTYQGIADAMAEQWGDCP